jgi:hypothetical protein
MPTGFGGHVPKSMATQSRGHGTPLPETVLPETVLPETVLPETVLPETVLPETVTFC